MAISKKIRFEVFKRDDFKCQYCGKSPPAVTLEIDHINPKSKKGKDNIENLITSCFDCNRGKKDVPLTKIPNTVQDNYEILKEKENQLKEYNKLIERIEKRKQKDMDEIDKVFTYFYTGYTLAEGFRNGTLKYFLSKLPIQTIKDAMYFACSKFPYHNNRAIKYFCGICYKKIRGED